MTSPSTENTGREARAFARRHAINMLRNEAVLHRDDEKYSALNALADKLERQWRAEKTRSAHRREDRAHAGR